MERIKKSDEIRFGEKQETRIATRWLGLQSSVPECAYIEPGEQYDDFDFRIFDAAGTIIALLEVKYRRSALARFGDSMFPLRKHDLAKTLDIPFFGVTEYECGSLVEVNLKDDPSSWRPVTRKDRPDAKPVPHVFYEKDKMIVLAGPGER